MSTKKSQGFGDSMAKIAKAIAADKAADKIAKALGMEDCGCDGRKDKLNNPDLLVNKIFYKNTEQDENIKK
jgi:hypothetical protein|tara:strand:- start:57 stop:269 length:213 start_codon:yes stop_codon:yes gene_type:complete